MDIPAVEQSDSNDDRQRKLNKVLSQLASEQLSSKDDYKLAARFFLSLYNDEFRHRYSEVYEVMSSPLPEVAVQERCSCLVENLRGLVSHDWIDVTSNEDESLFERLINSRGYFKLLDHVDLEARRLSTTEARMQSAVDSLNSAERTVSAACEETKRANKRLLKSKRSIKSLQKETIAVLGIFAAVVLVFNGAIGFSSSTIEALGVAPDLRSMVILCSLIGFVLINAIALLLSFIGAISGVEADGDEGESSKPIASSVLQFAAIIDICLCIVFLLAINGVWPVQMVCSSA